MAFPLSLRGKINVECSGERGPVVEAVRQRLAAERPLALRAVGDRIEFIGGVGAGGFGNWHLLSPISSGIVDVASVERSVVLRYELKFRQLLVVSLVFAFAFLACFLGFSSNRSAIDAAMVSCGAWLLLFGGNFVISALRFPAFLRHAVRSVPPSEST